MITALAVAKHLCVSVGFLSAKVHRDPFCGTGIERNSTARLMTCTGRRPTARKPKWEPSNAGRRVGDNRELQGDAGSLYRPHCVPYACGIFPDMLRTQRGIM